MRAFYVDKAKVEYKALHTSNWRDCKHPIWGWDGGEYRIKTEPTTDPFEEAKAPTVAKDKQDQAYIYIGPGINEDEVFVTPVRSIDVKKKSDFM